MRGKGEGAVYRVPADRSKPLQYWTGALELPTLDGERRRKVIRRKSKTELLAELAKMKKERDQYGDLNTQGLTVERWFEEWLRMTKKKIKPKTWRGYESVTRNHITPVIGKVKLDKLTPAHIRRVTDRITDGKGLSSTYALLAHRTMAVALKAAVNEGKIGSNPVERTTAPRKSSAAREALDLGEAITLLGHSRTDEQYGARWATALLTGARQAEVLGLEVNRITDVIDLSWQIQRLKLTDTPGVPEVPADFEYRHITGGLYFTRPKSAAGMRVIPLVDPLKSVLEAHIASQAPNPWGLVFTHGTRPADPSNDAEMWKRLRAQLELNPNVTIHDLRHSAVDLLYLAGVPEDLISEIVGHSTRTMTRAYKTRQNRDRLTLAMEQFSAQFMQLDDGRSQIRAIGA